MHPYLLMSEGGFLDYFFVWVIPPCNPNRYIASSLLGGNFRQTSYNERCGGIFGFSLCGNFGRFKDHVCTLKDITPFDRSRATIPSDN